MTTNLKVEMWPILKVFSYAENARLHSDEQISAIAKSITEFGFVNPCLVDAKGVLIAGHCRVLSAKTLGMKTVPVIRLGYLSDVQARALRLADNALPLQATWDPGRIKAELADLRMAGYEMNLLGFGDAQLLSFETWGDPLAGMPGLNAGDREPFQQMTFTLHDSQVETVKAAIGAAIALGAFDGPNQNSNGNGLARICGQFLERSRAERKREVSKGPAGRADRGAGGKRTGEANPLQRQGH